MIIKTFANEGRVFTGDQKERAELVGQVIKMIRGLGARAGSTLGFYCSKGFAKNGGLVSVFYEAVEGLGWNDPSCYLIIHPDMHGYELNVEDMGYKSFDVKDNSKSFDTAGFPDPLPFTEEYFEKEAEEFGRVQNVISNEMI